MFTVLTNAKTAHISGADCATVGNWKAWVRMRKAGEFATMTEALAAAEATGRTICKNCAKSAAALIEAETVTETVEVVETVTAPVLSLKEMRSTPGFVSFGLTVLGKVTAVALMQDGTYRVTDNRGEELARGLRSLKEAGV